MYATQLIGKNCIREKPAILGGRESELKDYSFCSTVIRIVAATEHNIVYEHKLCGVTRTSILDERFCDDNWVDYDALVADAEFSNVDRG